ncbi:lysis protein [Vibrio sp. V31_P5A7T61]|uniref:lysis protein n=1 Tax=Vibrio sp. V31_P5A7T61 TaxID=1938683 RepID=UPI001F3D1EF8|nr:lysis protein [Vibrio sp. V31_P5A7T61]
MKFIILTVSALFLITSLSFYLIERERRQLAEFERDQVTLQRDSLIRLQQQQSAKIKSFNELSIKHAEEAANAKKEIDSLRADVRNGAKRVFIKASCPEPVPKVDSAGSVGDAGAAEVERAVAEDILDLREMNSKAIRQILYLQGYIRTQCPLASHSD